MTPEFSSPPHIALLPMDSRPVCTQLPQQLAAIVGVQLDMPPRRYLNALKQPANHQAISEWLQDIPAQSTVILATDTLAYGGLIPSRQGDEPFTYCQKRVSEALTQLNQKRCCVIAYSSIMRTPNYNNAEEEPAYWADYGMDLHAYSAAMHRDGFAPETLTQRIPVDVLTHFLETRARNFELNQWLITQVEDQLIDELTFCLDDSGEYGLNKAEAATLSALIQEKNLSHTISLQTGADEVACSALSRTLCKIWNLTPNLHPVYSDAQGKDVLLKFDGIPAHSLIERHIERAGGKVSGDSQQADITVLAHTPPAIPKYQQGDWCEGLRPQSTPSQHSAITNLLDKLEEKPLIACDIAAANGSDPALIFKLLQWDNRNTLLYGYSGWNTPGNATGTAISMGILTWLGHQTNRFNPQALAQALFTRFADDWLYQAEVRRQLPNPLTDESELYLNILMHDGLQLLTQIIYPNAHQSQLPTLTFPCHRRFEIEINP